MEIRPPVPLPRPGQYQETPFPVWRLRKYEVLEAPVRVERVQRLPVPDSSLKVYSAEAPATVSELKDYAKWLVGLGEWRRRTHGNVNSPSLLSFNSQFEGGNLHSAYCQSPTLYDLHLSPDTNSKGHIQWFFFSITPLSPCTVTLRIVNFLKKKCLFISGMRPWCRVGSNDWERLQSDCLYYPNGHKTTLNSGKTLEFFTLQFDFSFLDGNKPVFFAFSEPYLYTNLQNQLRICAKYPHFKRRTLCYSSLGFPIELITISNRKFKGKSKGRARKKEVIVLTARAHPSETPGSMMMEGVLQALCEDSRILREQFTFKLVPMLNPDGVIIGNSRTGLEGADLNRRWSSDYSSAFPQITALKMLLRKWTAQGRLTLFCDLHGHAKAHNAFIYGCSKEEEGLQGYTQARLFPRILSQVSTALNYSQCSFKVHKSKLTTARVVVWQEVGLVPSYTLEASFHGGIHTETGSVKDWGRREYMEIGRDIVKALGIYGEMEVIRRKEVEGIKHFATLEHFSAPATLTSAQHSLPTRFLKSASGLRTRMKATESRTMLFATGWRKYFAAEEMQRVSEGRPSGVNDMNDDSSGSESNPSEDNLVPSDSFTQSTDRVTHILQSKKTTEKSHKLIRTNDIESTTNSSWFYRSHEKFSPGLPQDHLIRSISLFKTLASSRVTTGNEGLRGEYLTIPGQTQVGERDKKGNRRKSEHRVSTALPNFKAMKGGKVTVKDMLARKTEMFA